jgi:hypothetical protein
MFMINDAEVGLRNGSIERISEVSSDAVACEGGDEMGNPDRWLAKALLSAVTKNQPAKVERSK